MITAVSTASRLDWKGWLTGIMGAVISGGAGALGSGVGTIAVDPQHFNLSNSGAGHLLEAMGVTFIVSAVISLAKYLQTHPVPDAVVINTPGPVVVNPPPEKP